MPGQSKRPGSRRSRRTVRASSTLTCSQHHTLRYVCRGLEGTTDRLPGQITHRSSRVRETVWPGPMVEFLLATADLLFLAPCAMGEPNRWTPRQTDDIRVRCPYCSAVLAAHRLAGHLRKLPCSLMAHPPERPAPVRVPLLLDSTCARRTFEAGPCSECGQQTSRLWRYGRSNRGVVDICARCKPVVMNRSHGNVDLWAVVVDHKGGLRKDPPARP